MIRLQLFFLSLFILINGIVCAQQKNITLKHYNSENGLSDNQVTCVTKDKLGFLWIGTKDGLNRFDGREFYSFSDT